MLSFRRHPDSVFKLLCITFIVLFYTIFASFYDPPHALNRSSKPYGPKVQHEKWKGGTGGADTARLKRVEEAMGHAFHGYRVKAWGFDDIRPVSGKGVNSRYKWGGFILEAAPRLAIMGLGDELALCLDHIVENVDFSRPQDLVDPAIVTKRYVGALVALLEMAQAGIITGNKTTPMQRERITDKLMILGNKLLPAYATMAGLPFPRVDFLTGDGMPRPDNRESSLTLHEQHEYTIEPSDAVTVLENAGLTRVTGDTEFYMRAVQAWAPFVWDKYTEAFPGLIAGPLDIFGSRPDGLQRHWDGGHIDFYESLIKAIVLAPRDKLASIYQRRWLQSASAARYNLTSRSLPAENHTMQHLYLGKRDGDWYLNEMSQQACSAAGVIMLGARFTQRPDLVSFGKAILEGCRHLCISSPSGLGAESWSWLPMPLSPNSTFDPTTIRSAAELNQCGYWMSDPSFKFRPNYFASLFNAWRITGEQRYRDWAFEAFVSIERDCKTPFGFAGLRDVAEGYAGKGNWIDEVDGGLVLETLMWFWLIFADTDVMSLDRWVFTTAGYPLRRG